MVRLSHASALLLVAASTLAGGQPRLRGLTAPVPATAAPDSAALTLPTSTPVERAWWQAPQPKPSETECLMDHRFGCYVIKHRETCLGSKDGRPNETVHGLKVHGQPCVWCGGTACRDGAHTLCEPLDFLMHGEGKVFGTFFGKRTYQVAKCVDGQPREYQHVYRTPPPPVLPTLAPWWVPSRPENSTCLKSYTPGCSKIRDMGLCLTSKDGRSSERLGGFKVKDEPCVWCGGGVCHSNASTLCEPFDWLMHGEGNNFGLFYAKMDFQVAGCSHKKSFHLPEGADFSCLAEDANGCHSNTDAVSCLSSRDGRGSQHIAGLQVQGQPCVWCGGVACHSKNWNKCEPFDYALNGQGQAFDYFHAKLTWRLAGCKNGKPAAMTLDAFEDTVGGYLPPAATLAAGPAELVPFWVAQKPGANDTTCLQRHAAGCSAITDMATCMTSRDGSATPEIMGLKVAGEPCVWCGGAPCTTSTPSLCGPFDLLMYGEGKAFGSFSGKGIYKVADCTKGNIPRPNYDYSCLSSTDQAKGCTGIGDAETCLASKDGRSGTVGPLALGGEPCVWCGGGPCHTASSAKCEAFDFAVNGESVAFATFHAPGSFRLAACRDGKPQAATLSNFTSFVPGYTFKPLPPPKVPMFNASWWKSHPPAASELSCLMDHKFGCNVVRHRETCLGSKDGRPQSAFGGGVKVNGQPCVWCGGVACTSGSSAVCEPFDLLMNGEGQNFSSFYGKNRYQVARCKDGKPLPLTVTPTASPWMMVPMGSKAAQVLPPTTEGSSTAEATDRDVTLPTVPSTAEGSPTLGVEPSGASPATTSAAALPTASPLPVASTASPAAAGATTVAGVTAAPLVAVTTVAPDAGGTPAATTASPAATLAPGALPTLPPLPEGLPSLPGLPSASTTAAPADGSATEDDGSAPASGGSTTPSSTAAPDEVSSALPEGLPGLATLPPLPELPSVGGTVSTAAPSGATPSSTAAADARGLEDPAAATTAAPGLLPEGLPTLPTLPPLMPGLPLFGSTAPPASSSAAPGIADAASTAAPKDLPEGLGTTAAPAVAATLAPVELPEGLGTTAAPAIAATLAPVELPEGLGTTAAPAVAATLAPVELPEGLGTTAAPAVAATIAPVELPEGLGTTAAPAVAATIAPIELPEGLGTTAAPAIAAPATIAPVELPEGLGTTAAPAVAATLAPVELPEGLGSTIAPGAVGAASTAAPAEVPKDLGTTAGPIAATIAPVELPEGLGSTAAPAVAATIAPGTASPASTVAPVELPEGLPVLPTLPPLPALPAVNSTEDVDCWDACGNKGFCDFCGAGKACCRQGYIGAAAACEGATGFTLGGAWHHQCVPTSVTTTSAATGVAGNGSLVTRTSAAPGNGAFAQQAGGLGVETSNGTNDTNSTAAGVVLTGGYSWSWLWILLAALLCALLCIASWCMRRGSSKRKKSKKTKRSGKKAQRQDSEQDSMGSPTSAAASELEMRQPLVKGEERSANVGTPGGGADLFDLLDRNHDGVVSASEFQQAMGGAVPGASNAAMAVQPQPGLARPVMPPMHSQGAAALPGGRFVPAGAVAGAGLRPVYGGGMLPPGAVLPPGAPWSA